MAVADPLTSLKGYLLTKTTVTAQVVARIFGEELPATESEYMPRKCIVLASSGGRQGLGSFSNMDVHSYSLSTRSYATTLYDARILDRLVFETMMDISRFYLPGEVGLHYATQESGPFIMRDPDTTWPFALSTYTLMVGEAVSA